MMVWVTESPALSRAVTRSDANPSVLASGGWVIVTANRLPPRAAAACGALQVVPPSNDADTVADTPDGGAWPCWPETVKTIRSGDPATACDWEFSGRS